MVPGAEKETYETFLNTKTSNCGEKKIPKTQLAHLASSCNMQNICRTMTKTIACVKGRILELDQVGCV